MKNNLIFDFTADKENAKIYVKREFAAKKQLVWDAWTKAEILDQWWAPKPWKAETKSMDFTEGGSWLYAMVGPEGEKHWSRAEFQKIDAQKSYVALTGFADEDGNIISSGRSEWRTEFTDNDDTTIVDITLTFPTLADLEMHIEMGFKEGFSSGLENLDAVLAK